MPSQARISPDGYKRVVIWQPNSGFVVDFDFRKMIRGGTPNITKQYFNAGNGSDYDEVISRVFEIETPDNDLIEWVRVMKRVGCPVCVAGLSFNKVMLWLDPSNMSLTPSRSGFGSFAGETIRIKNDNFYSPIFDVRNLASGFPWYCADAEPVLDENGDPTGDYRLNDDYPDADWGWIVTGGDGISEYVDASGKLLQGTPAILEFEFPCGGAKIRTISFGLVEALSWDGTVLASTQGATLELPYLTWKLRITLRRGDYLPTLLLDDPGSMLQPRLGVCVDCDEPGEITPPWTVPTATADPENLKPTQVADATADPENLKRAGFLTATADPENLKHTGDDTPGNVDAQPENLKYNPTGGGTFGNPGGGFIPVQP